MDFEHSDKVKGLLSRIQAFMDEHVYPNEEDYHDFVTDPANIWKEWPKMEAGVRDPKTQALFEKLFTTCLQISPRDDRENIVLAEVFSGLNRLADARRSRISDAHMRMPGLLWFTLIAGGAITITFTFFFGNRNWRAHCLMTALLSGMIAMMLFVIHEVDHPSGGSVRVKPDSIERVLERIQSL